MPSSVQSDMIDNAVNIALNSHNNHFDVKKYVFIM